MRRGLRIVGILLLVAAAGIALRVLGTLRAAGVFERGTAVARAECRRIDGPPGAEDIVVDRARRVAYLAAYDRRAALRGEPVGGAVWMFRLDAPRAHLVRVAGDGSPAWRPHGMDLAVLPEGTRRLAVVNHPLRDGRTVHTIELFRIGADPGRLEHEATLADPEALRSPNDVALAPDGSVYATIDLAARTAFGRLLEAYLRLPWAYVVRFAEGGFRRVARGLHFGNGIAIDPAGRRVYVASLLDREIRVYDRAPDGSLALVSRISLPTAPDNLSLDADGTIWVAGHPKLLAFLAHARDPARPAPTHVLRVRSGPGEARVEEILRDDDGGLLPGASVAVPAGGGRFLVGAVFAPGILDCRLRPEGGSAAGG